MIDFKYKVDSVTVTGLEPGVALSGLSIHIAATGANATVFLGLYIIAAQFGTVKLITVDDAQIASLKAGAFYLNVHSVNKPSAVIRG